jgi:hypothetical protein
MRPWTCVLPLFIVRWLALRHGERLHVGGRTVVLGPPGVLFTVPADAPSCKLDVYVMAPRIDPRRRNWHLINMAMREHEKVHPNPDSGVDRG